VKVAVIGAGGFGRGLTVALARQDHDVVLWSRRRPKGLPEGAEATDDWGALEGASLLFLCVPSVHVQTVVSHLGRVLDGRHYLVHVSRGLIGTELETVSRFVTRHTAVRRVGCLAGPLNPRVLAEGSPSGAIVGTRFPEVAEAVGDALAGPSIRMYETDDIVGVEVASALVGLLALAAGFGLEAKVNPAALGLMMNRGLVESARVGVSLGGQEETFHGVAGTGDLMAAVAGDERAEVRLGRAIARGLTLTAAGEEAGAHIEGLTIARRVSEHAHRVGLDAPIATVIASFLAGHIGPEEGLRELMER
jgi:glycerol-3-phosphate dehydrogenase (NAD(P)+)